MKRIRISTIARMALGASLIMAWLATACAPPPATAVPGAEATSPTAPQSQQAAPSENIPATPKPTVSPDLHATDPDTVLLASGKVQLVEFFAYW